MKLLNTSEKLKNARVRGGSLFAQKVQQFRTKTDVFKTTYSTPRKILSEKNEKFGNSQFFWTLREKLSAGVVKTAFNGSKGTF